MQHADFVPLRIFSAFTMLEGAIEPKAIATRARELGFPAAAICDRNGLYGAMAFSAACVAVGVQPIIGTLLGVARPDRPQGAPADIDWLALYAQDARGYANLCALVSAAHLDQTGPADPHVPFAMLEAHADGLIALTAGAEGAIVTMLANGQHEAASAYLTRLRAIFGDRLYVEVSRRGDPSETAAEPHLIALADGQGVPLVATNPAAFADADFHPAHDALRCIATSAYLDSTDRVRSSPDAWIKPARDMAAAFADLPDALANTVTLAQRTAFAVPKREPILPTVAGDPDAQLIADARAGLARRLSRLPHADVTAYEARLAFELEVITGMRFASYFLIVADFIKWAKDQGIAVGPGRGSGAGSVVAWALTITDLDPLALGLLFERFLNPERRSMPDFDIDFCETRRDEVIRYVQHKYGRDHVAQIITFGRLKARAVLKDVGRVLQMNYGQVDRLAKIVPNHPTDPWTLSRTLNGGKDQHGREHGPVDEFRTQYRQDGDIRRLVDLAMRIEGLPRHSSTHAAGVVIGDRPLAQLIPLYRDPRSDMAVTQFDMKPLEDAGLVKFDFLGLKTLSVLQRALDLIEAREGHRPDIDALGWDDPAVYALLQRGETVGVFQLESEGMRRTLSAVRPTNFGDIIALVSLYRPGPMDNIPLFGARKNGREAIVYPHPALADILAETYGIFVYQEQVMQAAQVLAGYSLGEADLLRRAMGKKIKAEMEAQRAGFVAGCAERHGIDRAQANELFDLIDKFAGYGFNKSHAAAYALLAYQTAWLKAHFPADFFAASMAFDLSNTEKLSIFADDMRRLGVKALPPCVNGSASDFAVEPVGEALGVRYALGALRGVGEGAMEALCEERRAHGDFASIDDFAHRISPRLLNRKQLESLAGGGAFDCIAPERASVFAAAEAMLSVATRAEEARTTGQGGLFGGPADGGPPAVTLPRAAPWSLTERMAAEKEAFGFYFSAHPVDRYQHLTSANGVQTYAALCALPAAAEGTRVPATIGVLVEDVRWRTSARGRRYAMATLSDPSGQFVTSVFDDDVAAAMEATAKAGACALLGCELDWRAGDETPRIVVRTHRPLAAMAGSVRLSCTIAIDRAEGIAALAALLETRRGGRCDVALDLMQQTGATARVRIGRDFILDGETVQAIERVDGVVSVALKAADAPRLALVS